MRPLINSSGPCILRPPRQPEKYGLKWEVVLKWRDIYTENIGKMSLMAGLKMEGIVKLRGLKSQGPLYCSVANYKCSYNSRQSYPYKMEPHFVASQCNKLHFQSLAASEKRPPPN